MSVTIRPAQRSDSALILSLVRELAEYERRESEVEADESRIAEALFAPDPKLFCDLAEWDGEPAGFAVWFLSFSTFRGRHGIYLEDVFVRPAFRGRGIGRALLAHLARRCVERHYARFEWAVLEWNAPSIAFYRAIGAQVMDEWKICRLSGAALVRLAENGAQP